MQKVKVIEMLIGENHSTLCMVKEKDRDNAQQLVDWLNRFNETHSSQETGYFHELGTMLIQHNIPVPEILRFGSWLNFRGEPVEFVLKEIGVVDMAD